MSMQFFLDVYESYNETKQFQKNDKHAPAKLYKVENSKQCYNTYQSFQKSLKLVMQAMTSLNI